MKELTHTEQCEHIDTHIDSRLQEVTDRFESLLTHRMSAYESSIMKEVIRGNKLTEDLGHRVQSLETALAEYKFGWKVFTFLGAFFVGAVYFSIKLWEFTHTK